MSQTIDGRDWLEFSGDPIDLPPLVLIQDHEKSEVLELAGEIFDWVRDLGTEENDTLNLFGPTFIEEEIAIHSIKIREAENIERRQGNLAITLATHYLEMKSLWNIGDQIIKWTYECEKTFLGRCNSFFPQIWPLSMAPYWIQLLEDKSVHVNGTPVQIPVGYRKYFNIPPGIKELSPDYLIYMRGPSAKQAYDLWKDRITIQPMKHLPSEKFHFQVIG